MAACFTLVAIILGGLVMNLNKEDNYTTILASKNEEIKLPDNSKVWMTKGSEIKYANDFKNNRNLILSGKAMFDVIHNAQSPFSITTEDMEVTVLGTKFVINEQGEQYVEVIEGKVRVADLKNSKSQPHILAKGLAVKRSLAGNLAPNTVSDNSMYWATKTLSYEENLLTEVFKDLEEYFGKTVTLSKEFKDCPFTGKFSDKDLSSILESLKLIYNLSIEQTDSSIRIAGGTC